MDRRNPFEQSGAGRPPQLNQAAQLRAALGLPPTAEDNFFLQQQQQNQQQQHTTAQQQQQQDLQWRRLQLLHEQQLRREHEFPSDLQRRLQHSMFLNEQLQQLGAPLHVQQQQAAILRAEQEQLLQAEEQLRVRQQQQRLGAVFHPDDIAQPPPSLRDVTQRDRFAPIHPFDSNRVSQAAIESALQGDPRQLHDFQLQQQREEQVKAILSSYHLQNNEALANRNALDQQQLKIQQDLQRSLSRSSDDSSKNHKVASQPVQQPQGQSSSITTSTSKRPFVLEENSTEKGDVDDVVKSPVRTKKRRRTKAEMQAAKAAEGRAKELRSNETTRPLKDVLSPIQGTEHVGEDTNSVLPTLPFVSDQQQSGSNNVALGETGVSLDYSERSTRTNQSKTSNLGSETGKQEIEINVIDVDEVAESMVEVPEETVDASQLEEENVEEDTVVSSEDMCRKGNLSDLLDMAEEVDVVDDAAKVLVLGVGNAELMSESEIDSDDENYIPPTRPHGLPAPKDLKADISFPLDSPDPSTSFTCRICQLPEEPVYTEDFSDDQHRLLDRASNSKQKDKDLGNDSTHSKSKGKKAPSVLEYPYPIDTWWPSVSGMRKERRNNGEVSDEDHFDEAASPNGFQTCFRANEKKIAHRLTNLLEPGVLEKLPHCMIHRVRMKQKKNLTAPELVYCWQVTELYPNDIMVNCSKCGTWRHSACGGHYRPFSMRENTVKPFVALCDFCSEEERFLRKYPVGERRLERQRTEQLRRALATSAVMRHASFSKHGGTYKWPPGSVSTVHLGGHTRSVHVRHDKAEKQWTDMATRLGRGYGYRQKERVRSRTKELERLLVSIEDAEAYTERHNMILFLHRDIMRDKPVGLEQNAGNIFDPADDELFDSSSDSEETEGDLDPETHDSVGANNGDGGEERDPNECSNRGDQQRHYDEDSEDEDEANRPYQLNIESDGEPNGSNGAGNGTATALRRGQCARTGCTKRHRFDSQFCSDACGVSCMEHDLLRTLQDASEIHPSVLRS